MTLTTTIQPLSPANYTVEKNLLSSIGFKPFQERTLSLIDSFEKAINKIFTESLNEKVYRFRDISGYYSKPIDILYEGVYKFGSLEDYIGKIPLENQNEIAIKYNKLTKNAFIPYTFKLCILAPANNFATENNIKAIDPIVFAWFDINEKTNSGTDCFLIPLSHWI